MRYVFVLASCVLLVTVLSRSLADESILDKLKLGATTPNELAKVSFDNRSGTLNANGQIDVHFQDANGNQGVCCFVQDRLFKYTIALNENTPAFAATGGWDKMVEAGKEAFGVPKTNFGDLLTWDLEFIYFIISKRVPKCVEVTLCDKRLEQFANREPAEPPVALPKISGVTIHGGPYFFKGFRPESTSFVQLTEGTYLVHARHQGQGNFIVYMYSFDSKELVANEIGPASKTTCIRVHESVKKVAFLIQDTGGAWEIAVRKVPGEIGAMTIVKGWYHNPDVDQDQAGGK